MTAPYHDYQIVIDGRRVKLQDTSLEEARLALMDAMDALEALDDTQGQSRSILERWRDGLAVTPKDPA